MASDKRKVPDPADNYFDANTTLITVGFLAVYFMVYGIMNLVFDDEDHSTKASFVDVIFFVLLIGAGVAYYYSLETKKQDTFWEDLKKSTKAYLDNAYSVL